MYRSAASLLTQGAANTAADVTSGATQIGGGVINKVGSTIEGVHDNRATRLIGGGLKEVGNATTELGGATANLLVEVGQDASNVASGKVLMQGGDVGRGTMAGVQGVGATVAQRPMALLSAGTSRMVGGLDRGGEAVGVAGVGSRLKKLGCAH
jgi:hypothetical protein